MIEVGKLYDALKKTAAKEGVRGVNAFAHRVEADGSHVITLTLRREDVVPPPPPRPASAMVGAGPRLSTGTFMGPPKKP